MGKREDIREGIDQWLCEYLAHFNGGLDFNKLPKHRRISYRDMSYEIRAKLHSQGVVIKVDKLSPEELPKPCCLETATKLGVFYNTQKAMIDAGYTATKALIEQQKKSPSPL